MILGFYNFQAYISYLGEKLCNSENAIFVQTVVLHDEDMYLLGT